MGPKLHRGRPRGRRARHRLLPRGWLFDDGRRPASQGDPQTSARRRRPTSRASTPWCTWPSSPTTRSARTTPADHGDQPQGLGRRSRKAREAGRRQALRLCLLLLDLRRRRRRDATETSDLAPQTAYARCKILVEQEVRADGRRRFTPVFMRNATAYGACPRQRFDLVLNNLCGFAHTTGGIRMTSDGSPWRPITHIEDICEAMLCALRRRARRSPARPSTSATTARTTASARSPSARSLPRLRADSATPAATPAATASPSPRSSRSCRRFAVDGVRNRGRVRLRALFEHIALEEGDFKAAPYHAATAAGTSDQDPADRLRLLLAAV